MFRAGTAPRLSFASVFPVEIEPQRQCGMGFPVNLIFDTEHDSTKVVVWYAARQINHTQLD